MVPAVPEDTENPSKRLIWHVCATVGGCYVVISFCFVSSKHCRRPLLSISCHSAERADARRGHCLLSPSPRLRGGASAAGRCRSPRPGGALPSAGRLEPAATAGHVHRCRVDQRLAGHGESTAVPAMLLQGAEDSRERGHDRAGERLRYEFYLLS